MKQLTRSLEDYLEAILILDLSGRKAHSTTIAQHLGVSKPAVTKALKRLANRGYITKSTYSVAVFTKEGRALAKKVYYRHVIIKKFLMSIGVNEKIAEHDCCKIEHVISNETLRALAKQIKE